MTTMTDQEMRTVANDHYRSRFDEIGRILHLIERCTEYGHDEWADELRQRLMEMPLCVDLQSIDVPNETARWSVLLGTGGPADRVLVEADWDGGIERATYQHQDWFTPWIDATDQDDDTVVAFAEVAGYYASRLADGRRRPAGRVGHWERSDAVRRRRRLRP